MSEALNFQENNIEGQQESESGPRDVTEEFLSMSGGEFSGSFLRSLRHEPALSITVDWSDDLSKYIPIRLKAFLEDPDQYPSRRYPFKQKITATIRATEEQKNGPILGLSSSRNAFASGVRWEKIEN